MRPPNDRNERRRMSHKSSQFESPDVIVLGVRPGVRPNGKPPVRIFLGTQPEQYRPERVFVWSIEKVRDPARVYEIHLMSRLPGYRSRFWNTGFTNYRFAIPHYAGYQGKAIYNDVDQIYLADPGLLFDMDLGSHGYLAISPTDTSVMLMDCERMGRHWTLKGAQKRRKYALIRRAQKEPGCYGVLPPEWNARDHEHREGWTRCLHYTTLQRQPWKPFPERFYYFDNPDRGPWDALEREANLEAFQVFSASRPSRDHEIGESHQAFSGHTPHWWGELLEDVAQSSGFRTLLHIGKAGAFEGIDLPSVQVTHLDLAEFLKRATSTDETPTWDALCITEDLSRLSSADVPWIIDRLLGHAASVAVVAAPCDATRTVGHVPSRPEWWSWLMEGATQRNPRLHWRVALFPPGSPEEAEIRSGGRCLSATPTVWVLDDGKPGHRTQSLGLAHQLGWDYEIKQLRFNVLAELPNAWLRHGTAALRAESKAALQAPWPDLLIATGRRTAPVAAWIRRSALGKTKVVQGGRLGTLRDDPFDLGVAPRYAQLFPHERRMDVDLPITRVTQTALDEARGQWESRLDADGQPRWALLIGGPNAEHSFSSGAARRMGERVAERARAAGARIWVTTSRRTPKASADALEAALGDLCTRFYRWTPGAPGEENPFMGFLALADRLIVTGESASMLAEACASGRPVEIYPLPRSMRTPSAWVRLIARAVSDRIAARAYKRPVNRRGFERPQRRLERVSAGLLARGWIRPGGHSRQLHRHLVDAGLARIFGDDTPIRPGRPSETAMQVAREVRRLLGLVPKEKKGTAGEFRRPSAQRPSFGVMDASDGA